MTNLYLQIISRLEVIIEVPRKVTFATTKCGLLREHGMTTLVQHQQTSCVSPVALSPT
jgi:hypothetical protein